MGHVEMPEETSPAPSLPRSSIHNAAIEYMEMGLSVIPVKPDKKPYVAWEEYQRRLPTEEEIDSWWKQWPSANVAIICGKISGIFCVDADGPEGIDWMRQNLPTTSVYNQTAKGCHAIYLVPKNAVVGNQVRLAPQVDIRGDGGYFVAPPSIHECGTVYQWIFPEGLNAWDDLAEYEPPTAYRKPSSGNLNLSLATTRTNPIFTGVSKGSRNQTLAQLVGQWLGKGLGDDEIDILARTWNAQNIPPLGEKELVRTIQSVKRTDAKNHPIDTESEPETFDEPEVYESFPDFLLSPGGALQQVMDYTSTVSPVAIKTFALAGAIAFMGDLIGYKFQTETGLKTNMYIISLGHSGAGKNAPLKAIKRLLLIQKHPRAIPTRFTSEAAILKKLSEVNKNATDQTGNKRMIMLIDEIGDLLSGIKNPQSHKHDIPATLKSLFTNTDDGDQKDYAGAESIIIPWHHLSFYGTGAPAAFWDAITSDDIQNGLLPRLLIFQYDGRSPAPDYDAVDIESEIPAGLRQYIEVIESIRRPLIELGGDLYTRPDPLVIRQSDDARSIFKSWRLKHHEIQNDLRNDPTGISALHTRAAEHAAKLSLIHAISSCGPQCKSIGPDSIQYSTALIDHIISMMTSSIQKNITETEIARWKNKIIAGVKAGASNKKTKYPGATRRELMQSSCKGLLGKQVDEYLSTLVDAGEICQGLWHNERGPETAYYFIPKDETRRTRRSGKSTGFQSESEVKSDG